MSEEKERQKALNDFWDISDLIPKKSRSFGVARSTEPIEIRAASSYTTARNTEQQEEDRDVIKRYIPPHSDGRLSTSDQLEPCGEYCPEDSLIHRVSLKKWKCSYHYYQEFFQDAVRFQKIKGVPCEYVPFFSYVPQYNQLNEEQLAYYFWFRENAKAERFIKTDYSYVLLYIYELINLGEYLDVRQTQYRLMSLWNAYHESFPAIAGKLADWICDFSLIYRLAPPPNTEAALLHTIRVLKEYYIAMPKNDIEGCVRTLLRFCTSYDFHTSKFAKEHSVLFETHIFEAVKLAVAHYSTDGMLLSKLTFDDCRVVRDAYAGALCIAQQKYRIEVEYCSFSRSNELRFLVGDIVKYAENKIRAYVGIKSKMTVYAVPTDLKNVLDAYFVNAFPAKRVTRATQKPQAYEALYDLPKKPFSLRDAEKIEHESWDTTRDLIEAFEIGEEIPSATETPVLLSVPAEGEPEHNDSDLNLKKRLGSWCEAVLAVASGDRNSIAKAAREAGKMPDGVVDEINEIAFEVIGDVLLEETDDGYRVIEEYRSFLE